MPSAQKDIAVGHLLLERILDARRKSDALFDIVKPAAIFERPIPERHRIVFYVGHLEALDWNLLHETCCRTLLLTNTWDGAACHSDAGSRNWGECRDFHTGTRNPAEASSEPG